MSVAADEALIIGEESIGAGESRNVFLKVSEGYTGHDVYLPLRVIRGPEAGPTVFVTGAIHGDELNGAGIVREVLMNGPDALVRGALLLAPVVNVLGFDRVQRYLPDRRDLNRSFPGSVTGSLAARFANAVFEALVSVSDYGVDLHTAARGRTNFPNVRADLSDPKVGELARWFGVALMVDGKGPEGSFRRAAVKRGCPTIILEAGEIGKIEPGVVEVGARGVRNVLSRLGMIELSPVPPPYQAVVRKSTWVRAQAGGLVQFHVGPGELVEEGQPLGTHSTLLGEPREAIESPADGVILGMTTLPAVKPGDPVFHIAIPEKGIEPIALALGRSTRHTRGYHELARDLATSVDVADYPEDEEAEANREEQARPDPDSI